MALPIPLPDQLVAGPYELRAMGEEDWAVEVALSQDPEVLRWTHYRAQMKEADARERLRRSGAAGADADTYRFLISEGDDVLGVAGVFADPGAAPEIYYALLPTGRGRGAASLAVQTLSNWVLAHGSLTVTLVIFHGNAASQRVALRSGYLLRRRATTDHQGLIRATGIWERSI